MAQAFILVAEDDDLTRELLVTVLQRDGHRVVEAESGVEALELLKTQPVDLVLSDVQMARVGGMEVLAYVTEHSPSTPVVLITAFAQPEAAMDAIAQGAVDYLTKPVDVFALRAAVSRALERRRLSRENQRLLGETAGKRTLIGTSPPMLALYKQIAQVAPTQASVLLVGENGSGTELVARTLHERSRRSGGPYVTVHCASLADSLLEAELYGGASPGAFEEAKGGTLFLDEVGELPLRLQAQLLRVLQDGEIRRPGAAAPVAVSARVIAATHRDLAAEVREGRMREDLCDRLSVVSLRVPPLRERGDDIIELTRYFLMRHAAAFGRPVPDISEEAVARIRAHPWPGNVRELENALARAVAMSPRQVITPEDLPSLVGNAPGGALAQAIDADWPTLQELERRYIARVLQRTQDNKTQAANILGVDRRTVQRLFARQSGEPEGER